MNIQIIDNLIKNVWVSKEKTKQINFGVSDFNEILGYLVGSIEYKAEVVPGKKQTLEKAQVLGKTESLLPEGKLNQIHSLQQVFQQPALATMQYTVETKQNPTQQSLNVQDLVQEAVKQVHHPNLRPSSQNQLTDGPDKIYYQPVLVKQNNYNQQAIPMEGFTNQPPKSDSFTPRIEGLEAKVEIAPLSNLETSLQQGNANSTNIDFSGLKTSQVNQTEPRYSQGFFAEQIVKSLTHMKKNNLNQLIIELKPEFLGRVSINLTFEKGKMVGKLIVEKEEVKKIIEGQLSSLKTSFNNLNLKFEDFSVQYEKEFNELKADNGNFSNQQQKDRQESQYAKASKRVPIQQLAEEEYNPKETLEENLYQKRSWLGVNYFV